MQNKIAFLVPTTSREQTPNDLMATHLAEKLLSSIMKHDLQSKVTLFIGIDVDDPVFSIPENQAKLNSLCDIKWLNMKAEPGHLTAMWNQLAKYALEEGFSYFYACGDDIVFETDNSWIDEFYARLASSCNYGWVAGFSGNKRIATQFFFHENHLRLFGRLFPEEIRNIYCDDYLCLMYPAHTRHWLKHHRHMNAGGRNRYEPTIMDHGDVWEVINRDSAFFKDHFSSKFGDPNGKKFSDEVVLSFFNRIATNYLVFCDSQTAHEINMKFYEPVNWSGTIFNFDEMLGNKSTNDSLLCDIKNAFLQLPSSESVFLDIFLSSHWQDILFELTINESPIKLVRLNFKDINISQEAMTYIKKIGFSPLTKHTNSAVFYR